jgi:hypothetical protein
VFTAGPRDIRLGDDAGAAAAFIDYERQHAERRRLPPHGGSATGSSADTNSVPTLLFWSDARRRRVDAAMDVGGVAIISWMCRSPPIAPARLRQGPSRTEGCNPSAVVALSAGFEGIIPIL